MLAATEVSTVYDGEVSGIPCEDAVTSDDDKERCSGTGGEQHGFALVLVAMFVGAMAVGAGIGRSRPAAVALVVAGIVVLVIALLLDLPDTTGEGPLGEKFEQARAVKGTGFWLELAGGALASLAGALRLADRRRDCPPSPGGISTATAELTGL